PAASHLASAQSQIAPSQIRLDDAKVKYDRCKALFERKVIAREEYETAEATYNKALKSLEAAKDALNIVKNGVSRYNASDANTMVRATISGLVLDVPVKVGTSVIQANTFNDGTTIATIADMSNLIFKGKVDETEVGMLRQGMDMKISIGALPDFISTATLEYISPKGNNSTGANTFEIKAAVVPDPNVQLRSGYSANATVILASSGNALTVPESVIEWSGDSTFVYVLTDTTSTTRQTFDRIPVTTGMSDGLKIEIKQGLDSTSVLRAGVKKD
ncbi:MAG: efflux RND transporter periplasmic adaptor subunit, partial [Paramuribaculum sp.]|nr:efflux RND transporter periplasmic adaptor subunit [Paramuribaculum sp.]